jgi:hypothetical protein
MVILPRMYCNGSPLARLSTSEASLPPSPFGKDCIIHLSSFFASSASSSLFSASRCSSLSLSPGLICERCRLVKWVHDTSERCMKQMRQLLQIGDLNFIQEEMHEQLLYTKSMRAMYGCLLLLLCSCETTTTNLPGPSWRRRPSGNRRHWHRRPKKEWRYRSTPFQCPSMSCLSHQPHSINQLM